MRAPTPPTSSPTRRYAVRLGRQHCIPREGPCGLDFGRHPTRADCAEYRSRTDISYSFCSQRGYVYGSHASGKTFSQKSGLGNFDHQFADIYAVEQAIERFRSVLQAVDNGFTVLQFSLADPLNELAPALLPSRHEV